MSQQAHLWSRYHAAAIQTHDPERAAEIADEALAEYNKRFEVLSKLETELAQAVELIELREEQVYLGVHAMMIADDLIQSIERDDGKPDRHWLEQLKTHVKHHLHLVGNQYWTAVPMGMDPKNPKLRNRR